MHVVIVTNLPTPYRIPLFNALAAQLVRRGDRLTVLFLVRGYARRKWTVDEQSMIFDHTFAQGRHIVLGEALVAFSPALIMSLHRLHPDVVIVGSMGFPAVWTAIYAALRSVPFLLWSGETKIQNLRRRDLLGMRQMIRRHITRRAAGAVAYGRDAKEFLVSLGMSEPAVSIAINTVDTDFFSQIAPLRERGEPDKIRFLYVGHFTQLKGLMVLLEAFSRLDSQKADLHLVGEGEERNRLEAWVNEHKMNNVTFWGFRQKEDLPDIYGRCDVFVFPSFYDVWGLVCIEAMASGLPVLASRFAGCTRDIIDNGVNGFVIDPDDVGDVFEKMDFFIRRRQDLPTFAAAARERVRESLLIGHSVSGFERALQEMSTV